MAKGITTDSDRQAGRLVAAPVITYIKNADQSNWVYKTKTTKAGNGTDVTTTIRIEQYKDTLLGSFSPTTIAEITYSAKTNKIGVVSYNDKLPYTKLRELVPEIDTIKLLRGNYSETGQ